MTLETLVALCDEWTRLAPEVRDVLRAAARADEPFDAARRAQLGEAIRRTGNGRDVVDGRSWSFRVHLEAGDDAFRAESTILRTKYETFLDELCDQVVAPGHS